MYKHKKNYAIIKDLFYYNYIVNNGSQIKSFILFYFILFRQIFNYLRDNFKYKYIHPSSGDDTYMYH